MGLFSFFKKDKKSDSSLWGLLDSFHAKDDPDMEAYRSSKKFRSDKKVWDRLDKYHKGQKRSSKEHSKQEPLEDEEEKS